MPIQLTGDQAKLLALQKRLREAGERGLSRELNKALKAAAEPIAADERQAAESLPSKGTDNHGIRAGIAASVKVSVTRSQRNPGVRIRSNALLARASTSSKGWRHPVFGHDRWVRQVMAPGWWPATALRHRAEATEKVRQAIDNTAKKIAGR